MNTTQAFISKKDLILAVNELGHYADDDYLIETINSLPTIEACKQALENEASSLKQQVDQTAGQALELAISTLESIDKFYPTLMAKQSIETCKQALEQQVESVTINPLDGQMQVVTLSKDLTEAEPVAWISDDENFIEFRKDALLELCYKENEIFPLYTSPKDQSAEIAQLKAREQKLIANFHVNMIRAYPEKSHDEITAHINQVLEG